MTGIVAIITGIVVGYLIVGVLAISDLVDRKLSPKDRRRLLAANTRSTLILFWPWVIRDFSGKK